MLLLEVSSCSNGWNKKHLACVTLTCNCTILIPIRHGPVPHTGSLMVDLFQNSRNIASAKIWHFLALIALKHTKKPIKYWKRPKKAIKVILKARESKNGKILILLHICDHLVSKMKRIQYFDVSRSKRSKRSKRPQ